MNSKYLLIPKVVVGAILPLLLVLPHDLSAQGKGDSSPREQTLPITTSSKEALTLFQQGRDKAENLEFEQAAALFDQAIGKDPNFAMAYAARSMSGGGFNILQQNLKKAVSLADKVSAGEKHWILAMQASTDNDPVKQKEHLDQLLQMFPSDKRIQQQVAFYYNFTMSDYRTALGYYMKAIELDQNYAPPYNMLGYCQRSLGNYKASEQAFKTYITLLPNNPNPYDSYAELLLKMGRYDESIVEYQMALQKDPSFVVSLEGIAANYIYKGEYAKAREFYQQEFDKTSDITNKFAALNSIAVAYVYEGKTAEALKTIEQLRALSEKEHLVPSLLGTYMSAGYILAESGNLAEAVRQFEEGSKLREASLLPAGVKENGRLGVAINRCRVLSAVHEFDAAKAEAERCRAMVEANKNPYQEWSLNTALGLLDLEQAHYDQAINHFSKADPEDPYNWYYMAVAYDGKGDKENASKLYNKIINWNEKLTLSYALVHSRATMAGQVGSR